MLPESEQRAFVARVHNRIGRAQKDVSRVALRLLDAGHGEDDILNMLDSVYTAGYTFGYGEGYDQGEADGTD